MKSFKLNIQIVTPMILSNQMTLDSLLSAAVFAKNGAMGVDTTPHIPLKFNEELDVFHGSCLFLPQSFGYNHRRVSMVGGLRGERDMNTDKIKENRRNGYGYIDRQRGDYKTNLDHYESIQCREPIYFYGHGDIDSMLELMGLLVGIGRRAKQGNGQIGEFWADEIDDDYSIVLKDGSPARYVPQDKWDGISSKQDDAPVMLGAHKIPYWGGEESKIVFPNGLVEG